MSQLTVYTLYVFELIVTLPVYVRGYEKTKVFLTFCLVENRGCRRIKILRLGGVE